MTLKAVFYRSIGSCWIIRMVIFTLCFAGYLPAKSMEMAIVFQEHASSFQAEGPQVTHVDKKGKGKMGRIKAKVRKWAEPVKQQLGLRILLGLLAIVLILILLYSGLILSFWLYLELSSAAIIVFGLVGLAAIIGFVAIVRKLRNMRRKREGYQPEKRSKPTRKTTEQ